MGVMDTKKQKRRVDPEELAELGFSQRDIDDALNMERLGVFKMEPSDDLVERTLQKCIPLLRMKPAAEPDPVPSIFAPLGVGALEGYTVAMRTASPALRASLDWSQLFRSQQLPQACLAAVDFARSRRERPVIMLDNHNLVEPAWWGRDNGFRAFWNACQITNRIAVESGGPPNGTLVVLRHRVSDYSEDDLAAIRDMVRKGTSDVWWVPFDQAGRYQASGFIVMGEDHTWELKHKPSSPVQALEGFEETTGHARANYLRGELQGLARSALQIRDSGKVVADVGKIETLEGVRDFISSVLCG